MAKKYTYTPDFKRPRPTLKEWMQRLQQRPQQPQGGQANPYGQRPGDPNQVIRHGGYAATRGQRGGYAKHVTQTRRAGGTAATFHDWRKGQTGVSGIDWSSLPTGAAGAAEARMRLDQARIEQQLSGLDPGSGEYSRIMAERADMEGRPDVAKWRRGLAQALMTAEARAGISKRERTEKREYERPYREAKERRAERGVEIGEERLGLSQEQLTLSQQREQRIAQAQQEAAKQKRLDVRQTRELKLLGTRAVEIQTKRGEIDTRIGRLEARRHAWDEKVLKLESDWSGSKPEDRAAGAPKVNRQMAVYKRRIADIDKKITALEAKREITGKLRDANYRRREQMLGMKPPQSAKELTGEVMGALVKEAKGDKEKAIRLAIERGYR